jgi:hypothetical protein
MFQLHKELFLCVTQQEFRNRIMRAGGIAQVVEHLPSKCKVLNSNPGTTHTHTHTCTHNNNNNRIKKTTMQKLDFKVLSTCVSFWLCDIIYPFSDTGVVYHIFLSPVLTKVGFLPLVGI